MDLRLRTRAGAALSVVMLVSTLTVLVGPTAGAAVEQTGTNNCAAPSESDCPSGTTWTYTAATNVIQTTTAGKNFFKCTAPICVGVQHNTSASGENKMVVEQNQSANANNAVLTQTADLKQHNKNGPNRMDVVQQAELTNPNQGNGDVSLTSGQGVVAEQTNVAGDNHAGIGQNVSQIASGNVNLPTAKQTEQAQQTVHVPLQKSNSGNQDLTINQNETLTETLNAVDADQKQNTASVVAQKVLIGDGNPQPDVHDGMYTASGTNTAHSSQTQTFSQKASNFIGLVPQSLARSTQVMGSKDEAFEAAVLDWEIEAEEELGGESNTSCFQSKDWDQDTTPDEPLLGKTQQMWDELSILGRLFSTDTADCEQGAELTQDGPGESYRCVQLGKVHTKQVGELSQSCNGDLGGPEQSVRAKSFDARLYDCHNLEEAECDEDNTQIIEEEEEVVEEKDTTGQYGCGQGYWKEHSELWAGASVSPSSLFRNHFDNAGAYASLDNETMMQAISASGGGSTLQGAAGNLGRAAVAALLNAKHPDVPYELTSAQVKSKVASALGSADRLTILGTANELEGYNSGPVCPLA